MMDLTETPYAADLDAEERGWYEIVALVRRCTLEERMAPGYYDDPDWSLRDLVGHLGTWLAEAATQFERLRRGELRRPRCRHRRAQRHPSSTALRDQPWDVCWSQANAARTRMRQAWTLLPAPNDEAAWWIRKSAVDHYAEHVDRLAEWVDELEARRAH